MNFANAASCGCDNSRVTCISYLIDGCKVVGDLRGNTNQGDVVQVTFTVTAGAPVTLSLVSYDPPDSYFDANDASEQQIFDIDTGTFGPGTYTLTVHLPCSYYQVDFVCGYAIDHLGPAGSNIFYSAQNRLFSADNDGTTSPGNNPGCISGNVYCDTHNKGCFDSDESGIAYCQVNLTGTTSSGQSVSLTTYTAPDGRLHFQQPGGPAPTRSRKSIRKATATAPSPAAITAARSAATVLATSASVSSSAAATTTLAKPRCAATASACSSSNAAIAAVSDQADNFNTGKSMLVISGTTSADTITVTQSTSSRYTVTINGSSASFNNYDSSGKTVDLIVVYGFGGNNTITLNANVTTNAAIFGGDNGNTIQGGSVRHPDRRSRRG